MKQRQFGPQVPRLQRYIAQNQGNRNAIDRLVRGTRNIQPGNTNAYWHQVRAGNPILTT